MLPGQPELLPPEVRRVRDELRTVLENVHAMADQVDAQLQRFREEPDERA